MKSLRTTSSSRGAGRWAVLVCVVVISACASSSSSSLPIPIPEPIPADPPAGMELVWSDEFDGDEIDPTNWTYDIGGWGWGDR